MENSRSGLGYLKEIEHGRFGPARMDAQHLLVTSDGLQDATKCPLL
jgi:hypothetical protein